MNLTYRKKLKNYCTYAKNKAIKRLTRESNTRVKVLRKLNNIKKKQLRNQKERKSKDTYSTDMTLLNIPVNSNNIIQELENPFTYYNEDVAYVFFDLETGGFSPQKDILQIAMKSEKKVMSVYLTPIKNIDPTSTAVTGLSKNGRQLFLHGELVPTLTHKIAALKVIEYLESFSKKVVLIAHNCDFDSSRIVRFFQRLSLLNSFEKLVTGFVDSLPLFRKRFPDRKNHKLSDLGKDLLNLSVENAHNATIDIDILENLTVEYISWDDILKSVFSVQDVIIKIEKIVNEKIYSPTFSPMSSNF